MADSEAFLSRWSRLKRQAAGQPDALPENAPQDRVADHSAELEGAASATVKPSVDGPPSIDLSALPPLEAITAATDIRPFLATGVPVEIARAALRRAWVADPKIRDFIGIAENQWDFTAPETIPGFGPLRAIDDVRRLVADVLGDSQDSQPVDAAKASAPDRMLASSAQPVEVGQAALAIPGDMQQSANGLPTLPANETSSSGFDEAGGDSGVVQPSIAADDHGDDDEVVMPARPRRHGGALPE
jgi:hypothetical protein